MSLRGSVPGPAHSALNFAQCVINARSLQQTATSKGSCVESVVSSEESLCWTGDPLLSRGLVGMMQRVVCVTDGH